MTQRIIKFRAWDGKSMIEPYSVRHGKAFIIKKCDLNEPVIRGDDGSNYYKNWDVDIATEFPLMQFTGLCDKNGVEIYEDDLLSDGHFTWKVFKCNKTASHRVELISHYNQAVTDRLLFEILKGRESAGMACMVIGNIHQSPELSEE